MLMISSLPTSSAFCIFTVGHLHPLHALIFTLHQLMIWVYKLIKIIFFYGLVQANLFRLIYRVYRKPTTTVRRRRRVCEKNKCFDKFMKKVVRMPFPLIFKCFTDCIDRFFCYKDLF